LWQANADALVRCGLPSDSIHVAGSARSVATTCSPATGGKGNTPGASRGRRTPGRCMGPSD
jgi:hypothetical protein